MNKNIVCRVVKKKLEHANYLKYEPSSVTKSFSRNHPLTRQRCLWRMFSCTLRLASGMSIFEEGSSAHRGAKVSHVPAQPVVQMVTRRCFASTMRRQQDTRTMWEGAPQYGCSTRRCWHAPSSTFSTRSCTVM